MSPAREAVADILMCAGGLVTLLAALGIALRRDVREMLHYSSLLSVVGVPLVVTGLAITSSDWRGAVKLLLIAALLAGSGPIVGPATARAVERSNATGSVDDRGDLEEKV